MRRAVLVYNPKSGRQLSHRLLGTVVGPLESGGFEVEPAPTAGPGDATRLARQAAAEGCEVVFAMGGDGTLREVAAGIVGTGAALGALPAGTVNVLARAFALPRQAPAAARLLPRCRVREIDVGLAGGEPFLMMVSSGLDAAVMAGQNARLKRYLGQSAMLWAILRSWWTYPYPQIELRADGVAERASLVVVANIAQYGGSLRIAPGADFRDGQLDLVLFRGRGRAAALALARDVVRGRHVERQDVDVKPVARVEILGPPGIPVQLDGDALSASLPLAVSLAPQRLRVLLP